MKLLVFLFFLFVSVHSHALSNRSMASLGKEYVSKRDVQIHSILQRMMYQYKSANLDFDSVEQDEYLNRELGNYILERVIFLEAKSFGLAKVDETLVKREGSKVLARILKSEFSKMWKSLGVETDEYDIFVEQKLRSRKFISIKKEAAQVLVTDREIDQYMEQNKMEKELFSQEKLRSRVKQYLGNKQGEKQLREWFELLRNKYQVRVL
ncbi:MAG: hypothetical protein VX642_14700 [Bdellovibrionota bacterium]|nr:hypothetical protein [Bdellovibrionota bacterium]